MQAISILKILPSLFYTSHSVFVLSSSRVIDDVITKLNLRQSAFCIEIFDADIQSSLSFFHNIVPPPPRELARRLETHVSRKFQQRNRNKMPYDPLEISEEDPNMAQRFPGT